MLNRSGSQHAAVIPRNHLEATMNEYGRRAMEYWRQSRPAELATIPDPEGFFSTLGQEVASQVDPLTDQIAGPDPGGEGYLEKVGRLRMAQHQAEEVVLADLVYLPLETRDDEDQDEDYPDNLASMDLRWAEQERQERARELAEEEAEADRDWRARTGQQQ